MLMLPAHTHIPAPQIHSNSQPQSNHYYSRRNRACISWSAVIIDWPTFAPLYYVNELDQQPIRSGVANDISKITIGYDHVSCWDIISSRHLFQLFHCFYVSKLQFGLGLLLLKNNIGLDNIWQTVWFAELKIFRFSQSVISAAHILNIDSDWRDDRRPIITADTDHHWSIAQLIVTITSLTISD